MDECLGRRVATALCEVGEQAFSAIDYAQGVPDTTWLPEVGAKGWVLLTKDRQIRRRPIEVHALLQAGVKAFVVTATDLPVSDTIELLLKATKKMERVCQRKGPFIYNITRLGQFSEIAKGTLRRRAKKVKAKAATPVTPPAGSAPSGEGTQ